MLGGAPALCGVRRWHMHCMKWLQPPLPPPPPRPHGPNSQAQEGSGGAVYVLVYVWWVVSWVCIVFFYLLLSAPPPPPPLPPTQMTLRPDSCESHIAVWLTSCNVHVPMHTLETRIQNSAFMLLCDAVSAGKEETQYTREGPGKPGGQSWTVDWLKFNNSYFTVGWSPVPLTNWELMSGRLADGVSCQWATVMVFVGCTNVHSRGIVLLCAAAVDTACAAVQ